VGLRVIGPVFHEREDRRGSHQAHLSTRTTSVPGYPVLAYCFALAMIVGVPGLCLEDVFCVTVVFRPAMGSSVRGHHSETLCFRRQCSRCRPYRIAEAVASHPSYHRVFALVLAHAVFFLGILHGCFQVVCSTNCFFFGWEAPSHPRTVKIKNIKLYSGKRNEG
jgi:hypothetical protein